jgi:hypothetical protein
MQTAGYSGTPLAKKLGIKSGFNLRLVHQPGIILSCLPICRRTSFWWMIIQPRLTWSIFSPKNTWNWLISLPVLRQQITQDGIIWVSWPKKASKVATDVTEDKIRDYALQSGLVDVKVCAVDEVWSGLKLVIRVKDRL